MLKSFFTSAWRNLIKNKVSTALNVFGLVIGVAVCLLIGIWLQKESTFDNFHPNADNLFRITNTFKSESESFSQAPSGTALAAQLPRQLPIIRSACRVFPSQNKCRVGNNQFFESRVLIVDSNFFRFFGFRLEQGQPNEVLHSPDQVVLSEEMAIKYFGSPHGVIGKTLFVDDHPMTISGVVQNVPGNSHIQYDIIIPYTNLRNIVLSQYKTDLDDQWVGGWPFVYVQLTDPLKWKEAEKQINDAVAWASEKEWKANKMSYQYFLQPVRDIHLKSHLRYDAANNGSLSNVRIFSIVGVIVLMLACINYINLTTAGAVKRAKETSVRKVIGATKTQLIRQFFLETLITCAIALILGVAVTRALLPGFSTWIGQSYTFPLSGTNILIVLAFGLFISLLAGIYPAAMLSSFNPAVSLKGNFLHSGRGNLIRKGLVVFQFTITIGLVASILIISQQMNFIKHRSLGFNEKAVIEVNYNGDGIADKHYDLIKDDLIKDPAILKVSRHGSNVVGGLGNGWTTTVNARGDEVSTSIYHMDVDADYLDTYGMKLAAGRWFTKSIPTDTVSSVLVNEAAVRTFGWKTASDAIGKPFGKGAGRQYVIGVVRDFNFESLHKPVDALLIGFARGGNSLSVKIDANRIQEATRHIEKIWHQDASAVPLQYSFVDERIAEQYGSEQKMEMIFYGFSGLSLLIACLGLFGLSIFMVERKVKEIGVRKVLGASVPGIVVLLSKDFLRLVLLSVLIATPLAWYFMNNWIKDFAYHIDIGWTVFAVAGLIALFIALFTVSIRSIKAAVSNPINSLRTE